MLRNVVSGIRIEVSSKLIMSNVQGFGRPCTLGSWGLPKSLDKRRLEWQHANYTVLLRDRFLYNQKTLIQPKVSINVFSAFLVGLNMKGGDEINHGLWH